MVTILNTNENFTRTPKETGSSTAVIEVSFSQQISLKADTFVFRYAWQKAQREQEHAK